MKVEVLVSTMNQKDTSLIQKMNIQTDAIIINQTDNINASVEKIYENTVRWYSFNERGVGLSRNNALMRSNADICLMADDDMVYMNGYQEIVVEAFNTNPKADMILFNVPIHKKNGETRIKVKKNERIRFFNSLKYGTVNIAFRLETILKENMFFSLLFGGGAKYSSGEDSIFITDAIKKGLQVYSSKEIIAEIIEDESTWFQGYNEKYLYDRGALFRAIWGNKAFLLNLQFVIRHRKLYSDEYNIYRALKIMMNGSEEFS